VAVSPAHPHTPRRRARSRRRRARAHVIQHLITYLVWAVYVGVGVGVAGANGYLGHLSHAVPIVWAAGAVLAWPLVFIE
jgi:hypothetical protein